VAVGGAGQPDSGAERFERFHMLGAGATGAVFRAFDRMRGHEVALKTLLRLTPESLSRFKQEFRGLTGVVHPNLVTLYELHAAAGEWFFTMELVDGCSFIDYVRPGASAPAGTEGSTDSTLTSHSLIAEGPPTLLTAGAGGDQGGRNDPRRQRIVAAPLRSDRLHLALGQLARAVAALHRFGMLHRDLKPANVLVDRADRVVVCDFGLVARTGTREDGALGTPAYLAPEQARGLPCEASDWYSVGVMLYEAITGELPFSGTGQEILRAKTAGLPPRPISRSPGVGEELIELCMELLHPEPDRRPGGAELLQRIGAGGRRGAPVSLSPVPGGRERPALFGRSDRLHALRQAAADARQGAICALVHGPSGVGKTALVSEFLAEQKALGTTVLHSRCYERESVPYKILDGLLDDLVRTLGALSDAALQSIVPEHAAELCQLFPALYRIGALSRALATGDAGESVQARAFGALRQLLSGLCQRGPVIVAIDDLQWGDLDSAPWLRDLLYGDEQLPLLLIATHRAENLANSSVLRVLGGIGGRVREVAVGGLEQADARALVLSLLDGQGENAGELADAIVAEADGHPLFIAELVRSLEHGGFAAGTLTLREALLQRLQRLPAPAFRFLAAAAIAGRPLPVRALGRAARIGNEAQVLAILGAERLVRVDREGGVERVETAHDQVREAAVAVLDPDRSRRLHRRLARALEVDASQHTEMLIELWAGAGRMRRAARYALIAARRADSAFAFKHAATHYQFAHAHGQLDDDARHDVAVRLANALSCAGQLEAAAAGFLAAAGRGGADRSELHRCAAECLLRQGRLQETEALAARVLAEVGFSMPRNNRAALGRLLVLRARLALRGQRVQWREEAAVAPALRQRMDTCSSIGVALGLFLPRMGAVLQSQLLLDALDAGEPWWLQRALAAEAAFRAALGGRRARSQADRLLELAGRIGADHPTPAAPGMLLQIRGLCAYFLGDCGQAEELFAAGDISAPGRDLAVRLTASLARLFRVENLRTLGRFKELTQVYQRYARQALDDGDEYFSVRLIFTGGLTSWVSADQPEEAQRELDRACELVNRRGRAEGNLFYQHISDAEIALYIGDVDRAWQSALQAELAMRRLGMQSVTVARTIVRFLRGRAALARAHADPQQRTRDLRVADRCAFLLRCDSRDHGSWAIAYQLRATAAALRGRTDAAAQLLRRAIAEYERLELGRQVAVSRLRLGRLLGGSDGAALVAQGSGWLRDQGAKNPLGMAREYASGWPD
jgi:serine/threonine protein kinase/tetratricopeptide (TPR) repeat protein